MEVLTVEEVLVLFLVIKITAVLLHLVDTQHAGVNRLHTQVVVLELAINLALLLALGVLDPDALDVGALDDVVPFLILAAGVWLGQPEEGSLVKGLWEHECYLVPDAASLAGERLERLLKVLERLRP